MVPIASILSERGHEVNIIVPPWDNPDEGGQIYDSDGVTIRHLSVPCQNSLKFPILARKTVDVVSKLSPEVVHAFKPIGISGAVAAYFAARRGTSVVLDTDDWEGNGGQNRRREWGSVIKRVLHYQEVFTPHAVDAVTVASRTLQTQVWGRSVPAAKTFYVPNGQSRDRVNIEDRTGNKIMERLGLSDAPVVLLYTRFFEYDISRLIQIFSQIKAMHPSTVFVVIGKGRDGEHDDFAAEIDRAGLADSTEMLGWVKFDALPDYFAASDVAVYPFADSLINRAKCPAKLTELLLAGLPVVADKVGQISEYIQHDESGLLVQPDTVDPFADKVTALLTDESKRDQIGTTARERILSEYSWGRLTDTVEAAYDYAI
ncbi:glycosyltransferase family 4 protein [Haloarcula litorea]|uniref:glycosyltransferase family 4 protein n=1 Tax=Haloarcula litorea TaxID=3032579 RepID=UPI0023E8186C|nr:glycosyltransferase family 4 protein [Halomicroarcula sp. GDY20]